MPALFPWAKFRKKGAVKMHTLLDLRGNFPALVIITPGKIHDVNILDDLVFEPGAFYVMDRGYVDFGRLFRNCQSHIGQKAVMATEACMSYPYEPQIRLTTLRCWLGFRHKNGLAPIKDLFYSVNILKITFIVRLTEFMQENNDA